MAYVGLIGGAGLGLVIGGPLGALVGALAGHAVDRLFADEPKPIAFTVGVIALSAKMAKADGVVTHDEINAFHQVFDIPAGDMVDVQRLFDLAKGSTAGYDSYAGQLAAMFADEPATREDLMDALFHVAKADRAIHPDELAFLRDVGRIFGFTGIDYARIEARHVKGVPGDAYAVLDLGPDAADDEIKARRRALIADHHPDRMIARGMPEAAVRLATARVAAINAAYDNIARERGFK